VGIVPVEIHEEVFGFDVSEVKEILATPAVTPVPFAPKWVAGLSDVRGDIVTVVHLLERLGTSPSRSVAGDRTLPDLPPHLVLLDAHDRSMVGILVDRVGSVVTISENQKQPGQGICERGRATINGVDIRLIDPTAVMGKA